MVKGCSYVVPSITIRAHIFLYTCIDTERCRPYSIICKNVHLSRGSGTVHITTLTLGIKRRYIDIHAFCVQYDRVK